jgi:protein disulfide-isomerase
MKQLILSLAAGLMAFSFTISASAELKWSTDLPSAIAQAKKENKLVFMDFTGSDWCGYCIQLKKDVFDTKEFEAYAKDNLVLVEVDFPRKKKQAPELAKSNESLQDQYKPPGFPTIVVLNPAGKEVWRNSGHTLGGPSGWISKLNAAKKK